MKFVEKTKGAISIFLVIILVPMLTVSSLFVDASRVKLSTAVMSSAGDLTMNTALTNYDTVLKDMYGLFATAQDKEDLFAKLEDYYRTCIVSSGISGTAADSYVSELMASLGMVSEGDSSDLLNMQLTDFSTKEIPNANLANATIVKSQIVNFMKYRSPINTGLSFINSLKSFSSLSKETELVEKRKEYYEEQKGVMEDCKKAWEFINEYNKCEIAKGDTYLEDFTKKINNEYGVDYKDITRKIIKDLYNTQSYVSNAAYYSSVELFQGNQAGSFKTHNFYGDATPAAVDSRITSFNNAVNKVKAARDKLNNEMSYPTGAYDLQYLAQLNRKGLYRDYASAMSDLNYRYQHVIYSIDNEMVPNPDYGKDDEEDDEEDDDEPEFVPRDPKRDTSSYDSAFTSLKDEFMSKNDKIDEIASDIESKKLTYIFDTDKKIITMYEEYRDFKKDLTNAKSNLDQSLTYLNEVHEAAKEGGALDQKKDSWKTTTQAGELQNSALAKQDSAEIKDLSSFLKADEVKKLIDRLTNISKHLGEILTELEKYTFYGKKVSQIQCYEGYSSLYNILKDKIGDSALKKVPIVETALNNQINDWLNGKSVQGYSGDSWIKGNIDTSWIDDTGTEPKLIKNKLNFYTFLFTHFNLGDENSTELKKEDKAKGEDLLDKIESKSEDGATSKAEEAKKPNIEQTNEIKDKAELPSAGKNSSTPSGSVETKDDAVKNTKSSLSSMFFNLGEQIKSMAVTLRDDIYISDYVMSMLSYDTIENEYKYDAKKSGKSVDSSNLQLMTLTKNPINKENNFAYGKEVEYIIYGGSNKDNIIKSYGSIFGIRLGFNLVYAFMDSSIRDGALAIATPISAATLGVIPVPLIQAAIIIGLAVCESALDIYDLREGKPVPLFKNKDTWRLSFTGMVNVVKDTSKELISQAANYAIDKATDKLGEFLDKTDKELAEMTSEKKEELILEVKSSFDTMIERHANMAIQKLTTLANNAIEEAKLEIANFDKVQYVRDGLDKWLAEEGASVDTANDLSYIAKQEAVNVIKAKYIPTILEAIEAASDTAKGEVADLGAALQDEIEYIRENITNQIKKSCDKISSYREQMVTSVRESIAGGAKKLKDTINQKLDGAFGNTASTAVTGSKDTTGMASLLSFQYSDYMRLFVVIGLLINQDAILLRTADVIQCNMQHQKKEDAYRLKKSVTYVETTATVQVKPLLLALPLFAKVESNPKDNSRWYTIEYEGIKGY